jgi:hypothetical protein
MLLVEEGFPPRPYGDLGDFARASALGFSYPIGSVSAKAESRALNSDSAEFRVDTEILFNIDVGGFEGGIWSVVILCHSFSSVF